MAIVCFNYCGIYLCCTGSGYSVCETVVDSDTWRLAWSYLNKMKLTGLPVREHEMWRELDKIAERNNGLGISNGF